MRVWVKWISSPTLRSPTPIVWPPRVMAVVLVTVIVRAQPSSVESEICEALMARIVIAPVPGPFSPLGPVPLLGPWPGPGPFGLLEALGAAEASGAAEAPAAAGWLEGDGLTAIAVATGIASRAHAATTSPRRMPVARRIRGGRFGVRAGWLGSRITGGSSGRQVGLLMHAGLITVTVAIQSDGTACGS